MSRLRILAAANENTPLRWVRLDPHNSILRSGVDGTLSAEADDTACELVIPAERVAHIPLKLTAEQLSRLSDDNLPWLVEPLVSQDIGQLHLVRGTIEADEIVPVFAVDRHWLSQTIERLASQQIRPQRILLETLLTEWQPDSWSVVLKPGGGFVRTGTQSALILDCAPLAAPPVVLHLALQAQPGVKALRVYHDQGLGQVQAQGQGQESPLWDSAAWQTALGLPIHLAAATQAWRQAPASSSIDLARGAFAPPGKARHLARRLKLAGWLLLAVMLVNGLGAGIKTTLNTLEKQRLEDQIQSVLMATFPATSAILDPLRQMQQGLAQRTRAAGISAAYDFLPLLAQINQLAGAHIAGQIDAINFEAQQGIELTFRQSQGAQQAAEALKAAGLEVRIDSAANGHPRLRVMTQP